MDRQEIANIIAGTSRAEEKNNYLGSETKTISGTVIEKTDDGVIVDISDDVVNSEFDDEGKVEIQSSPYVEVGDDVTITLVGGGIKAPFISSSVGSGERLKQYIDASEQLATEASAAAATASQEASAASEIAQNAAAVANDGARLVLTSTRGQLFKNGSESTVLQVAIFPNGGGRLDTIEEVRSRFGNGAYIEWRYMNDSDGVWHIMVSGDSHLSQGGMWCTIGPDDVAIKTTFEATLNY